MSTEVLVSLPGCLAMEGLMKRPSMAFREVPLEAAYVISPCGLESPAVRRLSKKAALVFVHDTRLGESFVLIHTQRARAHFDCLTDVLTVLEGPLWDFIEGPPRYGCKVLERTKFGEFSLRALMKSVVEASKPKLVAA